VIKYFAYGDKMFSPQLRSIVSSVRVIGVAKIAGYKLFFHSRGIEDPSGKCNILPVKDIASEVFGVLYEIPMQDRYLLDKAEGLGNYNQEVRLKVYPFYHNTDIEQAEGIAAFTYIAHKDNIFEDLVPFTWYKEMVICGAREHHVPMEYIHHLEQYAAAIDPNVHRATKQTRYLESSVL